MLLTVLILKFAFAEQGYRYFETYINDTAAAKTAAKQAALYMAGEFPTHANHPSEQMYHAYSPITQMSAT